MILGFRSKITYIPRSPNSDFKHNFIKPIVNQIDFEAARTSCKGFSGTFPCVHFPSIVLRRTIDLFFICARTHTHYENVILYTCVCVYNPQVYTSVYGDIICFTCLVREIRLFTASVKEKSPAGS